MHNSGQSEKRMCVAAIVAALMPTLSVGAFAMPSAITTFPTPSAAILKRAVPRRKPSVPDEPTDAKPEDAQQHRVPLGVPNLSPCARLMYEAEQAKNAHEYDRAEQIYRFAQRQFPKDAEPALQLGELAYLQAHLEQAAKYAEAACKLDPVSAKTHDLYGRILLSRGETERGRREFTRAIAIDANCLDAHRQMADLLARAGDTDAADEHYRRVLELDPSDIKSRLNLAAHKGAVGNTASAIILLEEAAQFNRTSSALQLELGLLYWQVGRLNEAIDCFKTARDLDPHDAQAFELLAIASAIKGDWPSAQDYALSYTQVDSNNPNAQLLLAWSSYAAGELHEAKSQLDDVVAPASSESDLYNIRGLILTDLRRYKDAQAAFNHALELEPTNKAAQMNLVMLSVFDGRSSDAVKLADKLLHNNAGEPDVEALAAFAICNAATSEESAATTAAQAELGSAATMVKDCLSKDPKNELAHIVHARILRNENKAADAVQELQQIRSKRGASALLTVELAAAMFDAGRFKDCEELAQEALQIAPQNLQAKTMLALALGKQGNWDGELLYLRETVVRNPKDLRLRMSLADAFEHKGDLESAWDAYQAARKVAPTAAEPVLKLAHIAQQQGKPLVSRRLFKEAKSLQTAD